MILILDPHPATTEALDRALRQAGASVRCLRVGDAAAWIKGLASSPLVALVADPGPGLTLEAALRLVPRRKTVALVGLLEPSTAAMGAAWAAGAEGVVPVAHAAGAVAALQEALGRAHDRRATDRPAVAVEAAPVSDAGAAASAIVHEGMHLHATAAYAALLGLEAADLEGMTVLDVIDRADAARAKAWLREAASDGGVPPVDFGFVRADGTHVRLRAQLRPAVYEDEACQELMLTPLSVSAHEPSPPVAEPMLTPAPQVLEAVTSSRPSGFDAWAQAIERSQDSPTSSALAVALDPESSPVASIPWSDREGFWAACQALLEGQWPSGSVWPLAEGVWGVVHDDVGEPKEEAKRLASIVQTVQASVVSFGAHSRAINVVVAGVLLGPAWSELPSTTASRIEHDLTEALRTRSVKWFDPAARDRAEEDRVQALIASVQHALDHDQLSMLYRPILPLAGDPLELYEAFVRVETPEGLLRPDQFLPTVAAGGLALPIDRWVVQNGVKALSQHHAKTQRTPYVFVTLSPETLGADGLVDQLVSWATGPGVPRRHVVVQLPEAWVAGSMNVAQALRLALGQQGLGVALSHFGLRADSERVLDWMRPDWVKFDRQWSTPPIDPKNQEVLRALVQSARSQRIKTIADFVRDSGTATSFFALQVDHAAGDFLAGAGSDLSADFTV